LLADSLTLFVCLFHMVVDLDVLNKLLHQNFREMTRWEVYRAEVECGRLEWGIVHTETFFKENARLMEGPNGDFYFVKKLVKLVASHDEQVAAIACFDLGEFVRHYPNGKMVAKRLGAKDLVMHMIEHENAELRRHALQCVSKMLVQNWQYVSNS
jgi:V-type H+-transporting ATPase subunit H